MNKLVSTPVRFFSRRCRAYVVLASIALVGLLTAHWATSSTAAEVPSAKPLGAPAPKVTIAPVEEKFVTEYEELTGRVDAVETVELRARVSGHLDAVKFQAGQIVNRGDVLFTIDARWYRAQFELAQAEAERARAHADVAEREAKRAVDLLAAAALSQEEADSRRSRAQAARAALASAEASLATARLDLDHTEVRAPITGRVSRAWVTAGNLISGAPGAATLLATIVSVGEAFVYADLDETAVLRFHHLLRENRLATENGRVPVELQLSGEVEYPRRGYIESSDNRLNPGTGSLTLRMVFANSDGALIPGLFARVRVPVSAPHPALLVSERAIGTDQSQKFVLALEPNNTVVYRPVKLGGVIDGKRVIRDGLRPGEHIVVNGLQRVRPGMTVAPEPLVLAEPPPSTPSHSAAQLAQR